MRFKGRRQITDADGEVKEAAGTFAAQLPVMTSTKVIIGALVILLVLPFVELCNEDIGRLTGLQTLQVIVFKDKIAVYETISILNTFIINDWLNFIYFAFFFR